MKVSEQMTREVYVASPEDTLQQAARKMGEIDAGALPVGENGRLVGMVTDRDITVRCVAQGKGPDAKVRDAMSAEIKYCFEDQDLDEVARDMAQLQLRRLPVLDRGKRLVGILSLGDLATARADGAAAHALGRISQPGGEHNQSL